MTEISEKYFPAVCVNLQNVDGNVFVLIAVVRRALYDAGYKENAKQFVEEAFECGSYTDVLTLIGSYVTVVTNIDE